MKAKKLTASYVDSRSSYFWGHLTKIRGTRENPRFSGISNNKGVANLLSEYFGEVYNYVGFDEEDMQMLYNTVCERVS